MSQPHASQLRTCGINVPHWCGTKKTCDLDRPVKPDSETFCNAPHPDSVYDENKVQTVPIARCRRLPGCDGRHRAYLFGITKPAEWGSA